MRKAWDVALGYQDPWLGAGDPVEPRLPAGEPPRQFQYTPGVNIQMVPRSTEVIPFQMLRNLSEYTLVRIIIERIKEAMKAHEWDVTADDERLTMNYQEDISTVKEFFELPDRRHTWDEWLGMLLEDLLSIDAPSIYIRRTWDQRLWGLEIIDGATIKVLVDDRGFAPLPPAPAYQQYLYGTPAVNLTANELIYRPRNRRSNHFYGFSPVEQILFIINMGMRREMYDLAQFTDGNIPAAFLKMPPEWKPQQIKEYFEYVNLILQGDPQARAKFFPIPGTAGDVQKFRDDEVFGLFNKFDEWLARIICYAFGMSPLALIQVTNRSVGEELGDVEAEQGFASVKLYVETLMNWIIDHVIMMPHLKFVFTSDRSRLQSKKVDANDRYIKSGAKQIDEVRRENGDPPLGLPPGYPTATGYVLFPIPGATPPAAPTPVDPASVLAGTDEFAPAQIEGTPEEEAAESVEEEALEVSAEGMQPEGTYSYSAMVKALEKARQEELGKWERWAISRVGKPASERKFASMFIAPEEKGEIEKAIAAAKTPDQIRHLFGTRRMHKRPIRIQPPAPREAAQFVTELKTELKGILGAKVKQVIAQKPKP